MSDPDLLPRDFLVRRDDLRASEIAGAAVPEIGPGEALLRVDTFGLTANNITYAVMGTQMSYWNFFPAPEGFGRVPMWGFAEVVASETDGVDVGTRVYGYLPPSTYLAVTPVRVGAGGFADGAEHRLELPAAYQAYAATGADPFHTPDTEALQMLLRPLFLTSFLIDDQLADEELTQRGPVVFSSASSKTAIGTAHLLAQRGDVEVIGLTSARSVEFVQGLGIYDRTVTYDAIDSLATGPATYVDMAGDDDVRFAVHTHYGDALIHSMAVGLTHWQEFGAGAARPLPGPPPTLFFAPARAAKRAEDWGGAGLGQRAADAWRPFCAWAAGWLEIEHEQGLEAIQRVYLDVLEGRVAPSTAHVFSLT